MKVTAMQYSLNEKYLHFRIGEEIVAAFPVGSLFGFWLKSAATPKWTPLVPSTIYPNDPTTPHVILNPPAQDTGAALSPEVIREL